MLDLGNKIVKSVVLVQGSARERAEEIFFALDFNKVVVADDCPKSKEVHRTGSSARGSLSLAVSRYM